MFFVTLLPGENWLNIRGKPRSGHATSRGFTRAKRGLAGITLFTGIPLGFANAASGFKENEHCCYATQWETKNEDCCYATQWDAKKGRLLLRNPLEDAVWNMLEEPLLLRNPMGFRTVIYKDQTLVATQPNGTPCVKYIEKIVATQPFTWSRLH